MIRLRYPSLAHCLHIQEMLRTRTPCSIAIVLADKDDAPPHGGDACLLFTVVCRSVADCGVCYELEEAYPLVRVGRLPPGVLAVSPIEMHGVVVAETTAPAAAK